MRSDFRDRDVPDCRQPMTGRGEALPWMAGGKEVALSGVLLEVGKPISGELVRRRWSARMRSGWPLHGWSGWWRVAAAALLPECQGWHKWKPQATWMCA